MIYIDNSTKDEYYMVAFTLTHAILQHTYTSKTIEIPSKELETRFSKR